jgi:hypothetical protein
LGAERVVDSNTEVQKIVEGQGRGVVLEVGVVESVVTELDRVKGDTVKGDIVEDETVEQ